MLEFEKRDLIHGISVRYESILDLISKSPSTTILYMSLLPENIQNPFRCSKIPQIGLYWCFFGGKAALKIYTYYQASSNQGFYTGYYV